MATKRLWTISHFTYAVVHSKLLSNSCASRIVSSFSVRVRTFLAARMEFPQLHTRCARPSVRHLEDLSIVRERMQGSMCAIRCPLLNHISVIRPASTRMSSYSNVVSLKSNQV